MPVSFIWAPFMTNTFKNAHLYNHCIEPIFQKIVFFYNKGYIPLYIPLYMEYIDIYIYMKPERGPQTMFFGNDCCGIIVLQIQMGAGKGS